MTPAMKRRKKGRWLSLTGPCDGSAAVEFALILPILVAMLVLTFDLGTGGYIKARLQTAAQAGTTYVQKHGWNPREIVLAVREATNLPAVQVEARASCACVTGTDIVDTPCGHACPAGHLAGTFVSVNASTVYKPVIPYPGIDRSMTLSASSIVRVN